MTAHWTEDSAQKFAYRIASDFVEQVRETLKSKKWSQNKFAKKLGLTPGRVSQILNNPGNLTLETMALWARKLGGKVAVSYYEDGDSRNQRGPINGEVFRQCWVKAGMPINIWSMQESTQSVKADALSIATYFNQTYKGHHSGGHRRGKPAAKSETSVAHISSFESFDLEFRGGEPNDPATLRQLIKSERGVPL